MVSEYLNEIKTVSTEINVLFGKHSNLLAVAVPHKKREDRYPRNDKVEPIFSMSMQKRRFFSMPLAICLETFIKNFEDKHPVIVQKLLKQQYL